jgi:SulP family sulfate permease
VAETLAKMEEQHPGQRHLVISATGINFIDVAGAEFLAEEANRRRSMGGGLYLIRLKPGVCEPLNRGGYIDAIGRENLFAGKAEAVAAVTAKLDPEICRTCTARIFQECAGKPGPGTQTLGRTHAAAAPGNTLAAPAAA